MSTLLWPPPPSCDKKPPYFFHQINTFWEVLKWDREGVWRSETPLNLSHHPLTKICETWEGYKGPKRKVNDLFLWAPCIFIELYFTFISVVQIICWEYTKFGFQLSIFVASFIKAASKQTESVFFFKKQFVTNVKDVGRLHLGLVHRNLLPPPLHFQ